MPPAGGMVPPPMASDPPQPRAPSPQHNPQPPQAPPPQPPQDPPPQYQPQPQDPPAKHPPQPHAPPQMCNQQPSQVPSSLPVPQEYQDVPDQQQHSASAGERTLLMRDLQRWMDDTYLSSCFPKEDVVSIKIIRNKQIMQTEYYGFIEFRTRAIAEQVLRTHNGRMMPDNIQIFILEWATLGGSWKHGDVGADYTIFVENLALNVTDYKLQETFRDCFSTVKGAQVVTDSATGLSKGYGVVRFGDQNEQTRAVIEMNGRLCSTKPMQIGPASSNEKDGQQQYATKAKGDDHNGAAKDNQNFNIVLISHNDTTRYAVGEQLLRLSVSADELVTYQQEARHQNWESWYIACFLNKKERNFVKETEKDCGRAWFRTANRKFTILDALGHEKYVQNIKTGVSQPDVAILVISANEDEYPTEFAVEGQIRRDVRLARRIGISRFIILVDKINQIGRCKARYEEILLEMTVVLGNIGPTFLPVSILDRTNFNSLFEVLDSIHIPPRNPQAPLRLSKHPGGLYFVECGTLRVGERVLAWPDEVTVRVKKIYSGSGRVLRAKCGSCIMVDFSGKGNYLDSISFLSAGAQQICDDDYVPVAIDDGDLPNNLCDDCKAVGFWSDGRCTECTLKERFDENYWRYCTRCYRYHQKGAYCTKCRDSIMTLTERELKGAPKVQGSFVRWFKCLKCSFLSQFFTLSGHYCGHCETDDSSDGENSHERSSDDDKSKSSDSSYSYDGGKSSESSK